MQIFFQWPLPEKHTQEKFFFHIAAQYLAAQVWEDL